MPPWPKKTADGDLSERTATVIFADLQQHLVMHLAAIIGVAALALRDQLRLRLVLLFSIALDIIYYASNMGGPSWDDVFWNVVTFSVNAWVLTQLILDRTHIGLSADEEWLFRAFGTLSPGEFRRLLKLGTWVTAADRTVLTVEDQTPDNLYYVLEGEIEIVKAGRTNTFSPPAFIGEIAFLEKRTASATVNVCAGTRYLVWSSQGLATCLSRKQSLRIAVVRLLSADLADKVARA